VSPEVDCVGFLQWALPRLGRRWAGYRKVRRQVCRRVRRRADVLGLASLADYRERLERDPDEWSELDALTNVTISRFYRDRGVFEFLESDVLPALVDSAREAGRGVVRAWSAGCASGEEPFTLAILWELAIAPHVRLQIVATDVEPSMLRRAAEGRYPRSALRELPGPWRDAAFARHGDELVLASRFRRHVVLARHDIRAQPPRGPFDLVLCRNLAFTYFDEAGQRETVRRLAGVTRSGAALVVGRHEDLPGGEAGFDPWAPRLGVFRRAG
jgi:chemotaxis protein methyltransferase CheR